EVMSFRAPTVTSPETAAAASLVHRFKKRFRLLIGDSYNPCPMICTLRAKDGLWLWFCITAVLLVT
ncbi:MAG: hypothetical protein V1897_05180, partial [Pseudomonadota bacterium]